MIFARCKYGIWIIRTMGTIPLGVGREEGGTGNAERRRIYDLVQPYVAQYIPI